MAIDPQSIASIGQNGPDIAGSTMKAYTLADTMDRQQLSRMQLESEKRDQANLQTLGTLSKDPKYSLATPEGQNAFAAKAMELDPQLGMKVQRNISEMQRDAAQLDLAHIGLVKEQNDAWGNILSPAAETIMGARKAGVPDAQIVAQVMPILKNGSETLKNVKLSNGQSLLTPEMATKIGPLMSEQDPTKFLDGVMGYANSQANSAAKLRELEKARLDRENKESEIESRGNKIETVMQNGRPMRVEFDKKGNQVRVLGEAPPTAATVQVGGPAALTLLGELAIRGINLPARTAGSVIAGLKKNYPNKSDAEIADMVATGQATLAGTKAEKRTEGAQVGKVDIATREIPQFAEQALAASAKIPRGEFKPFNRLRLLADSEFSNPDLKELKSYLNSLSNAYDVAAARGGTDVNKRAEAHAMLDAADSPEALARAIQVMQKEAGIALKAGQEALHGSQSPTPGPASPTAAPSPAATGGAGGGTSQDQQALAWANANSNDPRAAAIKKRLGAQ